MKSVNESLSHRLNNFLYSITMWLCLTASASLLVGDFVRGAGIVSGILLFLILKDKQEEEYIRQHLAEMEELERRLTDYAKSNEEKGE